MSGPKPAHLERRGAVYAIRLRIPLALASQLGMVELRRSLYTKDAREARRRCLSATVWFRELMMQFANVGGSREALEAAAGRYFDRLAKEHHGPHGFDKRDPEYDRAYWLTEIRTQLVELDELLVSCDFADAPFRKRLYVEEIAADAGLVFNDLADDLKSYALILALRVERETLEHFRQLLDDPLRKFVPSDEVLASLDRQKAAKPIAAMVPPRLANAVTLKDQGQTYLEEKRLHGLSKSHIEELARVLRWLAEELGDTSDLRGVTPERMRAFRRDLQRLKAEKGQAIPFKRKLTDDPSQQLKSVTSGRYWKSVQGLFAWLLESGELDVDPTAGIRLPRQKGEVAKSPEPFSASELRVLFEAPLFKGYLSPKRPHSTGECRRRLGHWWSNVLLMFTGLRAGELAQLLPSDFSFDSPIPHLLVRTENEDGEVVKQVKTAAGIRAVPLAAPLIVLGLRQFIEARKKARPKDRVFAEFRPGKHGRNSEGLSAFGGRLLKNAGVWKQGRATHVWRHTFVTALRAGSVIDEDIAALVGHEGVSQTSRYGTKEQPLDRKAATIARLDFGFDVVTALGGPYDKARHA